MAVLAEQVIKKGGAINTKGTDDDRIVLDDPDLLGRIQALGEDCVVNIIVASSCEEGGTPSKTLGTNVMVNRGC